MSEKPGMRFSVGFIVMTCLGALLGGCAQAGVLGGDDHFVWVREPVVGSGRPDQVAARHCGQFGKKAVYERSFELQHGQLREVHAYLCQ